MADTSLGRQSHSAIPAQGQLSTSMSSNLLPPRLMGLFSNLSITQRANPLIGPLRILPAELLLSIFLMIPDHRNTIMLVCRSWKNIIQATGQFWTRIAICPYFAIPDMTESQYASRLRLLVERSGLMQVDIVWNFHPKLNPELKQKLVTYLLSHVPFHRWKSVDIVTTGGKHDDTPIHSTTMGDIERPSRLQKLTLKHMSSDEHPPLLILLEQSSISVSHIDIEHFHSNSAQRYPNLFRGVTTLSISAITRQITDLCVNLSILNVSSLPLEELRLPQLHTLRVKQMVYLQHLANIRAPSLKHLSISSFAPSTGKIEVDLPNLHTLSLLYGELWPLSFIRAVTLEVLQVESKAQSTFMMDRAGILSRLVNSTDYTLSPINLTLDIPVNLQGFAWFLRRSPSAEHIDILVSSCGVFESYIDNSKLMKQISEEFAVPSFSQSSRLHEMSMELPQMQQLCPNLKTLSIRFDEKYIGRNHWTKWARGVLNGRPQSAFRCICLEWWDGDRVTVTMKEALEYGKQPPVKI